MNRAAIEAFSRKAASGRRSAFGTKVKFRGAEHDWPLEPPMEDSSLVSGGVRSKVEIVARVPATLTPLPKYGEPVEIVSTGRKLRVVNVLPSDAGNPLAAEHIVELAA